MLINDLEYLEVTNNSEQVNGGYELLVAASTTNISGVYRGEGRVNGGINGYSRADLGYSDRWGSGGPSVSADSGAYFYAY